MITPSEQEFFVVREPSEVARCIEASGRGWRERWEQEGVCPYPDAALHRYHGFAHLPGNQAFSRVLSFGGADGQEVLPVLGRTQRVTVIDPGVSALCDPLARLGAELRLPRADGTIPDPDRTYDLITCFGALAAVPDPAGALAELERCLAPGGWLLLCEPIVDGGARRLRPGAHAGTWRGIPLRTLDGLVSGIDLELRHRALCNFTLSRLMGRRRFSRSTTVRLDAAVCRLFSWSVHYRASKWWHRLRPNNAAYVLVKTR